MAISRQQKEEFVGRYTDKLSRCQAVYLTDYRGMTVAQISDFRGQLREDSDAELTVTKNRLFKVAVQTNSIRDNVSTNEKSRLSPEREMQLRL